jgi:hypothetical protein
MRMAQQFSPFTGEQIGRLRMSGAAFVAACLIALAGSRAVACNTPVYRYAMYNWPPSPYQVFFLQRGAMSKDDEALHKKLGELAQEGAAAANVAMEVVDLEKQPPDRLPEPVRQALQKDKTLPKHLVIAPWDAEIFAGRLDAAALQALVDSPLRTQLGEMLDSGKLAVLVLVTGEDKAENERAEKVAGETVAQVAAGNLPSQPESQPGTEDPDAPKQRLELGLIKLSRTDPAEQWLLRSLMAIEPELNDAQWTKQPMLFAVYGRGRAMPAFVGKGITTENLAELVGFLSGACSCQVKDSNPGRDLLIRWDWEATSSRLAANEESPDQLQSGYAEFSVSGVAQSMTSEVKQPAEGGDRSPPGGTAAPKEQEKGSLGSPPAGKPNPAPSTKANDSGAVAVESRLPPPTAAVEGSAGKRLMWRLSLGLGAVAALVLLVGSLWIVKRPKGAA